MWVIVRFTIQKIADRYSRRNYTSKITYFKQVGITVSLMTRIDIGTVYPCA